MPVCRNCKKVNKEGSKFCSTCGTALDSASDNVPLTPEAPLRKGKKIGAQAAGMLIIDCIPVAGFLFSFVWSWFKFRNTKIKQISVSVIFLVLNIFMTLFVYTSAVDLMKNSLTREAQKQNILIGTDSEAPNAGNPLQNGSANETGTLPLENIPGMGFSSVPSQMPEFSEGTAEPATSEIPAENNQQPSDAENIPKIDEDGNMYLDTDGDGKDNVFVDKDGNTHVDTDGDGKFDTVYEGEYSDQEIEK